MKEWLKIIGLLLIIIAVLFSTVYLFTKNSFIEGFDLSKTGNIGDTIGGITAPIVGIVGSVLVYLSFRQQIEANDLLKKQNEKNNNFDRLHELYKESKNDLYSLKYNGYEVNNARTAGLSYKSKTPHDYIGPDGVIRFIEELTADNFNLKANSNYEAYTKQFVQWMRGNIFLREKIQNSKLDTLDKQILQEKMNYIHYILHPSLANFCRDAQDFLSKKDKNEYPPIEAYLGTFEEYESGILKFFNESL